MPSEEVDINMFTHNSKHIVISNEIVNSNLQLYGTFPDDVGEQLTNVCFDNLLKLNLDRIFVTWTTYWILCEQLTNSLWLFFKTKN